MGSAGWAWGDGRIGGRSRRRRGRVFGFPGKAPRLAGERRGGGSWAGFAASERDP
ncbi:hypothetical protein PSMK_09080 [Phycisphaera mikurensis NBRC 102666]|uniref:Uncharacterized protein n=1 Tax=Phycisphaera mikurensis (strain NBRC 102666 / KCTC 22515 / FYK2301M01) TaxID=1142394 RepID=I0ICS9_PHYMF|nr:hypothetical protein PSMK_09080 [Phycisphaera mikurensis NBRC 102666]